MSHPNMQAVRYHDYGGPQALTLEQVPRPQPQAVKSSSARNLDFVRSLGADEVIDYYATAFETVVKDLDVVIDTAGDSVIERSMKVLRPGGVFVTVATFISPDAGKLYGVR